jgi:AcrR family transcriptional regulator
MEPKEREAELIKAALAHATVVGYTNVTRKSLADYAKCSEALVSARFGTMKQLRRAIMRHAIMEGNLRVIAQGLAVRDAQARKAPDELKEQARAALA